MPSTALTPLRFRRLMQDLGRARSAARPFPLSRLQAYLRKAGPLLDASALGPQPGRAPLAAPRLRAFVDAVAPRLRSARAAGEFINVWTVAGLRRNEVRNAAVLAWFMEPSGTHGLGPAVLSEVLNRAAARPGWRPLALDMARASVRTELRPQGSDADRVDIAIETPDHVVFVEVKIDAGEGREQLARYAAAAAAMHKGWRLILLSPAAPKSLPPGSVWLTWAELTAALKAVAGALSPSLGRTLLRQFAAHARAFS